MPLPCLPDRTGRRSAETLASPETGLMHYHGVAEGNADGDFLRLIRSLRDIQSNAARVRVACGENNE